MREFELIKVVEELFGKEDLDVPAGTHDAAFLRRGTEFLVFTCDTVNEISDFPKYMKPGEFGKMAVAVTLSDLAASGARPMVFLSSISMKKADEELFRAILGGIKEWCEKFGVKVAGGDIDFSPVLTIAGFAVGAAKRVITRAKAKPGDRLFITAPLGKAQLCLEMLEKGFVRDELPYAEKLYTPEPRIDEGLRIAEFANALTDISDSLSVSAHLISRDSRVKVVLNPDVDLSHLTGYVDKEKALELFLFGGGDYELLFTAEDSDVGIEIGRIEEGSGVFLGKKALEFRGYSHF